MKRLVWVVLVTAAATAAFLLPEPDSAGQPDFASLAGSDVPAATGVWHCPLAEATFERETILTVASPEATTARFSFPNPVPGEEAENTRLAVAGPGAVDLAVSDVALRGDAPGFIELATPLGAAFQLTAADLAVAGDRCIGAIPDVWHVPGGSTQEGRTLRLRLFNPFPETAIVTVLATSEFGEEPIPELQGLVVNDRSWRDVEFEDTLKFRDALSFTITQQEGQVLPAVVLTVGQDEASWPGTTLSTTWEFPVSRVSGTEPLLALTNPGSDPVSVSIDLFTVEGLASDARLVNVDGRSPAMIPLGDLTEGSLGLRVRSDGPVAAVVIASGPGGAAGTVGVEAPALRWLLPGSLGGTGDVSSLWLMNSGPSTVTVSLRPLGNPDASTEKVSLGAGTVRQVFAVEGAEGYLVDAVAPISVAWSLQSSATNSAAFVAGIPSER